MSRRAPGGLAESRVAANSAFSEATLGPCPALITRTDGAGGSTRALNGTPSATPSAHSVSTLGFPLAASNWDSVDFAIPARLASSERESPARVRSRRREAAIQSRGSRGGGLSDILFAPSVRSFVLTNGGRTVQCSEHAYGRANSLGP